MNAPPTKKEKEGNVAGSDLQVEEMGIQRRLVKPHAKLSAPAPHNPD